MAKPRMLFLCGCDTSTDDAQEDQIDKKTLEISQSDDEVYTAMAELADELPDNSPRFVLLSYPLTMVCCSVWTYGAFSLATTHGSR